MILLRPDCLVFETLAGENIPCAVSEMTIELIGDALEFVDSDIVQNAAHAVLHYFKNDLGRTTVTLREFSSELEKVLRSLGIQVQADPEIAVELPLVYSAPPSPQPASPPVHPQLPVL